jgi:FkbH-like protein
MSDYIKKLAWLKAIDQEDFTTKVQQINTNPKALENICSNSLSLNQLIHVANTQEPNQTKKSINFAYIANYTTQYITKAIAGTGPRYSLHLNIYSNVFGAGIQDILTKDSNLIKFDPDVTLIAFDKLFPQDLQSYNSISSGTLEEMENSARSLLHTLKTKIKSHVIIQNIPTATHNRYGNIDSAINDTSRHCIHRFNVFLSALAREMSCPILDIDHLSSTIGKSVWLDQSQWNLAKLPFNLDFTPLYADHVVRVLAATQGLSKKCLVLDLDNTLWGGIVGDDGVDNVKIGQGDAQSEAYTQLQKYILGLKNRGIILAVCSKNEEDIAKRPFLEREEMILRLTDIAIFKANWNDKASNIKEISERLNIGIESMVFLDDNPVERDFVRQSLPSITVLEVEADPSNLLKALEHCGCFETISITDEDKSRTELYRANSKRETAKHQSLSTESYLESLDMECKIMHFQPETIKRVTQLINKTNQFNLTTKRYTETQVGEISKDATFKTFQVELNDKFGNNGLVSVLIFRQMGKTWECDTWLTSCRVFGRTLENFILNNIVTLAIKSEIVTISAKYIPTEKNKFVESLLPDMGFELNSRDNIWELSVSNYAEKTSYISQHKASNK